MSKPQSVKRMCQKRNGRGPKHRNDAFSDKTMNRICAIARGGKSGFFSVLPALPQAALAVTKEPPPP